MALKKLWVKAGSAAAGRVALFERHAEHPNGEAYVAGEKAVQVARTATVDAKLHQQVLVEVESKAIKQGESAKGQTGGGNGGGNGAPTSANGGAGS